MTRTDRDHDLERACAELAAFQAAVDHHALVTVADASGNIVRANDSFCQNTGYSRAELVGRDHRLLASGLHPRTFWADVWRTISHGTVWRGEVCNRSKDGRLLWHDTTIVPVRDADDHVVQYIAIRNDTTVRKRTEQGLLAARQAADAASRAKCGVLAQASQALQAPLASLFDRVERLHGLAGAVPVESELESLRAQAPVVLGLVDDLVELARLDADARPPEPSNVDVAVVAADVLARAGAQAAAPGAGLRLEIAASPGTFATDPVRLRQVLALLVEDAVRRARGGTVTVSLRRPAPAAASGGLEIDVADTGRPLTGDEMDSLFEAPLRNEGASCRDAARPLGLCLARRLAGVLEGDIAVRSDRGAGTVLTLSLKPLRGDPSAAAADGAARTNGQGAAVRYAGVREEHDRRRQRVLVVDDAPVVHELVARHLRDFGLATEYAGGGLEALRSATRQPPDLILLDYDLADMDGLETIRRLRCIEHLETVPVILLTGSPDPALEVQAFRNGAVDFLRKPFQPAVLRARVRAALQTRALRDLLEREALHDRLTGLPNRTLIQGRIGDAVAMKRADPSRNYAVLFLDFDRFKLLNDTLGHEAGDELLRQIAQRMRTVTRSTDLLVPGISQALTARLGGDEFVMLLEGLRSTPDAILVAERLLRSLSMEFEIHGTHVTSTASIGIVLGDESYGSASEILRDADAAMYEAKSAGRGRGVVFDAAMRARVENRVVIERDLRIALERQELFLEYQPIVALDSGAVEGVEALLRWAHPQRGRVPPSEFIQVAEETGLIGPIGEWALQRACRDLLLLRQQMGARAPRSVSVNVSRQQLGAREFPGRVDAILGATGLEPAALQLEVTENGIMREPEQAVRALRALKALGVGVHVDDFGTGSSSLACLHQFPVDTLKIDRSFVANSGETPGLAALLLAIVQMARTLGIGVVAEGIETPDQLLLLQSIECQYGQGYLLGRPMALETIANFQREPAPALPAVESNVA